MRGAGTGPSPSPSRWCGPGDLQALWHDLNEYYFAGRLSPIEIAWSARLTSSVGMFVSRVGPRHSDRSQARRLINLSIPLLKDQHARETLGTLAHEMIHQWQYDVLKRRPNHGLDFARKMADMNRDGLGITIRHALAYTVKALVRYAWRCGQCGQVYQRQRRSIRPRDHRCGSCAGALREVGLQQVKGKKVKGKTEAEFRDRRGFGTAASLRKPVQLELNLAIP